MEENNNNCENCIHCYFDECLIQDQVSQDLRQFLNDGNYGCDWVCPQFQPIEEN